jgi:hypothetical protein
MQVLVDDPLPPFCDIFMIERGSARPELIQKNPKAPPITIPRNLTFAE